MKLIKLIITILGLYPIINLFKEFHIHKWVMGVETIKSNIYLREIKFDVGSRYCPKCGKKQIKSYSSGKWFDAKLTKKEMRDYKLNQLLDDR